MKVQGYEVPEGILTKIEKWMRTSGRAFTAGDLTALIREEGAKAHDKALSADGAVAMRLADRLLQKHKAAGDLVIRSQQGERPRWGWKR